MVRLALHEGSLALIKPVRSPSITVLRRDTTLVEDAGLSLSLDHDPEVRHQQCLLGVPMMGGKQHGYITSAFTKSHGGEKSTFFFFFFDQIGQLKSAGVQRASAM